MSNSTAVEAPTSAPPPHKQQHSHSSRPGGHSSAPHHHHSCVLDPNAVLAAATPPIPQWQSFLFASTAPTIVAPFTNQFAVAKTQLQIQGSAKEPLYRGMSDVFRASAVSPDGLKTLQRGIIPVMMREASKNLFRLGMYPTFISHLHDEKDGAAPVWKRIIAGAASGGVGAIACNPFEITRIKSQARDLNALAAETNGIAAGIYRQSSIGGFYRGTGLSVTLGAVCTSVNLTTYTLLHEAAVHQLNMEDGPLVDSGCALISAFCAALAMNPVDVLRTRVMTSPTPAADGGAFRVAARILRTEGPFAFLAGFVPSFCRIGPHFVLTFMLLEQMRRYAKANLAMKAREDYLASVFRSIDADGSGEIDRQELTMALREDGGTLYDEEDSDRLAEEIFNVADSNGDGVLCLKEFVHAADSPQVGRLLRERHLLAVFRSMDINGDGTLCESELLNAYSRNLRQRSGDGYELCEDKELREDVKHIMDKIDKDGDRSINFKEFVVAVDMLRESEENLIMSNLFRSGFSVGE